jgi:hypothetical protein
VYADRVPLFWFSTCYDPYDHIILGTTSGDFFIPAFQCPHRVERIGTLGDGGKWVCGLDRVAKQEKCVVYSFGPFLLSFCFFPPLILPPGINNDSSFESSLLRRAPSCEIWGYDYSVKSVRPFSLFVLRRIRDSHACKQWGPEINNNTELSKRTHFHPWALGPADRHGENDDPKFWSLDSLMELNGVCPLFPLGSSLSGSQPLTFIRSYVYRCAQG